MTPLMNNFTNIDMDDGWVYPVAKPYLLLLAPCDEYIVMDDLKLDETSLGKWH